jgi:hypothetical protein
VQAQNNVAAVPVHPAVFRDPAGGGVRSARVVVGTRIVLLLFLVVQVFDGLFTYVAVDALGIAAEGNRLLAAAMNGFGAMPTLVVAKLVAAAGGLLLYLRGWHRVLAMVTTLYALAAIGPWLMVYVSWGRFD